MAISVNLGGNRLGSGNKMNVTMHGYSRSTHNLSKKFRSSMAPGVLYPAHIIPCLIGDDINIDIDAMIKTLPTNGPLMGTFKFQADVFQCPIRLYQGILHNNPTNIGLNMKNVLLPKIYLETSYDRLAEDFSNCQINPTSLVKYCGISGIGEFYAASTDSIQRTGRRFSALPFLMYYDIVKNYYANKQEENAYVITGDTESNSIINRLTEYGSQWSYYKTDDIFDRKTAINKDNIFETFEFGDTISRLRLKLEFNTEVNFNLIKELTFSLLTEDSDDIWSIQEMLDNNLAYLEKANEKVNDKYVYEFSFNLDEKLMEGSINITLNESETIRKIDNIKLQSFPLENIDKMRRIILSKNDFNDLVLLKRNQYGTETNEDDTDFLPYSTLTNVHYMANGTTTETDNMYNMNGLCVKTYQSDIFNNWINTEWIEGDNGVNEISKISVNDGSFTIDALNLAQKVYNLLNRIVTCDGTYQAWQSAISGQEVAGHYESPIYCGGMSSEIVFEEIASTSASADQPLGTLAGRGRMNGQKGGHLKIHINELSYIMVIISITPRIDYYQGNKWFMTDIDTADDYHKAALDGIGFQDLIGEQMAWWDTTTRLNFSGEGEVVARSSIGKTPAWINYMTEYDEVYGDFARGNGKNFMVLGRSYDKKRAQISSGQFTPWSVKDFTTYIDPSKFNYAFSDASLSAQNFWCQMLFKVEARRIMSAKMIPNL